ncbi:hypothetical protein FACS1894113_3110 [Alphaproteobacteria bacterium]|nr:hypothetical protein FACS1894113_3110 [Alphaproteobacteria bacterium]
MIAKIEIDGKEYEVKRGDNLLSVAQKLGVFIPHLCYFSKLSPSGKCGICAVEINDKAIELSCLLPVENGLRVATHNEKIQNFRKKNINRILRMHNIECCKCSKNGFCSLQGATASIYRKEKNIDNFKGNTNKALPIKINDDIIYDKSKCIFCMRCVKFANEICGKNIESPEDLRNMKNNDFIGNLVDLCPTAALNQSNINEQNSLLDSEYIETFSISNVFMQPITAFSSNNQIIKVSATEHFIDDKTRFLHKDLNNLSYKFDNEKYKEIIEKLAEKISENNDKKCLFIIGDNIDIESFFYIKYLQKHKNNVTISIDDFNIPRLFLENSLKNIDKLILADAVIIVNPLSINLVQALLTTIKNLKDKIIINIDELENFAENNKQNSKLFSYKRPALVLFSNFFESANVPENIISDFKKKYEEAYLTTIETFVIPPSLSLILSNNLPEFSPLNCLNEDWNFICQIGDISKNIELKHDLYVQNAAFSENIPAPHFLQDSCLYLNIFGKTINTKTLISTELKPNREFLFDLMSKIFKDEFSDINTKIQNEIKERFLNT